MIGLDRRGAPRGTRCGRRDDAIGGDRTDAIGRHQLPPPAEDAAGCVGEPALTGATCAAIPTQANANPGHSSVADDRRQVAR